ncbi:hypothetical protein ACHAWF_013897, partial [Thalassiosira exigua]
IEEEEKIQRRREVLCDVAAGVGGSLYALVYFPSGDGGGNGGKCRVYKYDLSSKKGGAALVQKIKVGSVEVAEGGGTPRFGLAVRGQSMAVRLGNQLRTIDLVSGERLCKADLPEEATAASSGGEGGSAPLVLSSDGKYLAAAEERQVAIFSFDKKGGKNKGKGKGKDKDKGKMQAVAVLSAKEDAPVSHLELCASNDELSVLAFQSSAGAASLLSVPTEAGDASSLAPQMPQASLRPDDDASHALVHAGFHPRDPANALKLRFRRARAASRGAAGAGTELPSETLSYGDFKGAIVVGKSLEGDDSKKQSKRKAEAKNAALAAGEKGREARGAEDLGQVREEKRARVAEGGGGDARGEVAGGGDEEEDDFQDVEGDAEEEGGQTIAERLAMISSAMEATDEESSSDDDEEDDDEDRSAAAAAPAPTTFKPRSATSESLAALLTQALTSGDPSQLNAALQVTDRRVVESTVRALRDLDVASRRASGPPNAAASATTTRYVPALTAHVIRRMARKHSLVAPLGVWIRSVLAVTAGGLAEGAEDEGAAREGRDLARGLGPLRSFLEERAEALPDLLRLEGRLALLGRGGR